MTTLQRPGPVAAAGIKSQPPTVADLMGTAVGTNCPGKCPVTFGEWTTEERGASSALRHHDGDEQK